VGGAPFHLKSALKVTHPPSKIADFHRFPLKAYSHKRQRKKFNYDEYEVEKRLSKEL